jgi:hypothetical protein
LSLEQFDNLLNVLPQISEELSKRGHAAADVPMTDGQRIKTKEQKAKARKANVEATSDEDEDF